jgi:uncharacterized membrane protein
VSWQRVEAGVPGAVSVPGTATGLAAALIVGGTAAAAGTVPWSDVPAVSAGALLGSMLESLLGASGVPIGHHARNVLNTAVGAGVALTLMEA